MGLRYEIRSVEEQAKRSRDRKIWLALGVIAVLVTGWISWEGHYRDRVFPKRFAVVHDGMLFRSGQLTDAVVERTWRRNGIEVVINLGEDKPNRPHQEAARRAASELDIDRDLFSLQGDGTGKPATFAAAIGRIREAQLAGQPTIVHCMAGKHRTGMVIAMYRILYDDWSADRAWNELLSFDVQHPARMRAYLNKNLPEICRLLVRSGSLKRIPDPMPRVP